MMKNGGSFFMFVSLLILISQQLKYFYVSHDKLCQTKMRLIKMIIKHFYERDSCFYRQRRDKCSVTDRLFSTISDASLCLP